MNAFHLDPYLAVRAASLYVVVVMTGVAWLWRPPTTRAIAGACLGFVWNLSAMLLLHLLAMQFGWWRFDARGGLLLGMPVDLYLEWAWLWGVVPTLALSSLPIGVVVLAALAADLILMPNAKPVLQLGPAWLTGEAVGLAIGLIPAQLLARWTMRDERLVARAALQVVAFAGLTLFVLPIVAIQGSQSDWNNPFARPAWQISLLAQLLAVPAILGLSAVQEFVTRGRGTPVPFDPPRQLVTTGVYAYVANPMQLSAVALLLLMGLMLHNAWVAAAGVMAHIYSAGLAGWDEDDDLRRRYGDAWVAYGRGVRRWLPLRRPWHRTDSPPSRLFVSESCNMCHEVAVWFERRAARHLTIIPAEYHPSRALQRITYEPGDGSRPASGIEAVARALEHIHLGWAFVGCVLRLPVVGALAQLLADASGAEPRAIPEAPGTRKAG